MGLPGAVGAVTAVLLSVALVAGGPTAIDAPDAQVMHAAEQVTSPSNGTA